MSTHTTEHRTSQAALDAHLGGISATTTFFTATASIVIYTVASEHRLR